jgi:Domain of unknown function (DUF4442)
MDILSIPFHEHLSIRESDDSDYVFKLESNPKFNNHLETIHACAQLTLAEATSGEFLLQEFHKFRTDFIPVIRKTEAKYQKPAIGTLYSRAEFANAEKAGLIDELLTKNRALIRIKVEIFDVEKDKTLTVFFDWFLVKKS